MDSVGPAPEGGANPGEEGNSLATHARRDEKLHLLILIVIMGLLASVAPLLAHSAYRGSADLHAAMELASTLFGVLAGLSLILRHSSLGNRFHLLIGLAFFVNGAGDFVHGFLVFGASRGWVGAPYSSMAQFTPATYVAGQLMMGIILLLAPHLPTHMRTSQKPRQEALRATLVAGVLTAVATVLLFRLPLREFILPSRPVPRPFDLLSVTVMVAAMVAFVWEYHRRLDQLTWWIALSLGVNVVGQILMAFSRELFDPYFDVANTYKLLAYMIPLAGLTLYQNSVVLDHRRARDALATSERRFRDIATTMGDWVWETSADFKITYSSDRVREVLGYEPEDMLGKGPGDLLPPEEYERFKRAMDMPRARENDFRGLVHTHLHRLGHEVILETTGIPVRDESGKLVGYRGTHRDITKTVQAKETLELALEGTRTLLERVPFGVIVVNRNDRTLRRTNDAALRILGFGSPDEIVGRRCSECICPVNVRTCPIIDDGDTVDNLEKTIRGKDGREIPVLKTVLPMQLEGEAVLLETFVDISERKRAEEELVQRIDETEEANRKLEILLSDATGRERRMVELKQEVNELLAELNRPGQYDAPKEVSAFLSSTSGGRFPESGEPIVGAEEDAADAGDEPPDRRTA